MTSLIPKIKVGSKKKRDKMDLSFDNSTTIGFGHVQPTMCREMVPGSTFEVKTNSFVRLSPLVLPTFGRMSLIHKHVFVPISSIWEPFNSFLSGQPYSFNGQSVKWNKTPYFQLSRAVAKIISNYSNISIYVKNPNPTEGDDYIPVGLTPVEVTERNNSDYTISATQPYETSKVDLDAYQEACRQVKSEADRKLSVGDFGLLSDASTYANYSSWYNDHLPDPEMFTTYEDHNVNVTYSTDQIRAYNALLSGFSPDITGIQQAWTDLVYGQKSVFDVVGAPLLGLATAQNPTGISNDGLGTILLGGYYIEASRSAQVLSVRTESNLVGNIVPITAGVGQVSDMADSELGFVDYRNCDYFTEYTVSGTGRTYGIAFKLKPVARRLRSIFIGLGFQFSPFDTLEFSPFKLFAFYKAWFELFRPKREYAFSDTACYKLMMDCRDISKINITTSQAFNWDAFMLELSEAYYYLPQDYFGMSTVKPAQQFTASPIDNISAKYIKLGSYDGSELDASQNAVPLDRYVDDLRSGVNPSSTSYSSDPVVSVPVNLKSSGSSVPTSANISAIGIKMAMRLLKFANKNTIVGRSIYDYIKAHFGISIDDADGTGQIVFIGDDDIAIQVSDVMSTAQTEQAYIGEYAGRGIGYGGSKDYVFTAKEFGFWITLSVVIPKSGYFQGYLRENRHLERLDFFTPEFDALGYQILERGEVMDDYTHKFARFNPIDGYGFTRNAGFGFVPRYSEYKTGRNIVNGDLSLNSVDDSMSAYYLDRRFPRFDGSAISYEDASGVVHPIYQLTEPSFKPSVVFDNFRRIDPSDRLGDYGRIFRYDALARDPFIIHSIFSVKAILPAKSLSKSFDTIEDDDSDVIEITHS